MGILEGYLMGLGFVLALATVAAVFGLILLIVLFVRYLTEKKPSGTPEGPDSPV